jgi:hypothetical protein
MFLADVPALVLLVIACAAAVTLACAGQWYVHRRFSEHYFVQHNEVGGIIFAVAGTLYAVVLGFLTVIAWQHFAEARQLVAAESAAATDAWHTAVDLPAARRTRVRQDVLQYATIMFGSEWPQMRGGGFDKRGDVVVMDAMSAAGAFNPADLGQSNAQNATMQQLGVLHDDRLRRLADNASGISWFEWLVLFIGAACIISFCWLFGLENRRVHLLMTSAVTIIIASTLVLLFELQYPFRSSLSIPSDSWQGVVEHIHFMQSGSQMDMRM